MDISQAKNSIKFFWTGLLMHLTYRKQISVQWHERQLVWHKGELLKPLYHLIRHLGQELATEGLKKLSVEKNSETADLNEDKKITYITQHIITN